MSENGGAPFRCAICGASLEFVCKQCQCIPCIDRARERGLESLRLAPDMVAVSSVADIVARFETIERYLDCEAAEAAREESE